MTTFANVATEARGGQTQTDTRAAQAKQWQRETSTQLVQAHGGIDQQETEYAVIKSADMDQSMQ